MAGNIFDRASDLFDKSMDAASDLFGKSKDVASDIANSAGDITKRGVIKAKIADQSLEYDRLMKRLGTVLYEQLKDDPKYAEANPDLFREIANCVQRKQELEDELLAAEAAADTAKPVDVTPVEPDSAADVASEAEEVVAEVVEDAQPVEDKQ